MLYTIARNIYKAYSDKIVILEQAQAEKKDAIYQYNLDVHEERITAEQRAKMFRLTDEISAAMVKGCNVTHTHMGVTASYSVRGVITRYSKEKGWTYSLELQDKSGCIVYAALEDTEVQDQ